MFTRILLFTCLVFFITACDASDPQRDPTTESVPDTLPAPEQTTGYDNEEGYSTDQMSTEVVKKNVHRGEKEVANDSRLNRSPLANDAYPDRYAYRVGAHLDSLWYDPQVPFDVAPPRRDRAPLFSRDCLQSNDPVGCSYAKLQEYYRNIGLDPAITGRVYATFILNEEGGVHHVVSVTSPEGCDHCEARALEILQGMPDWVPALEKGVPVRSTVRLPLPISG